METIRRKFSNGFEIELIDYYPVLERTYKVDEPQSHDWLIANAKPEWISLDIGAHVGMYSMLLSSLCPRKQIYAFEADMDTFHKLQHNLDHNNISIASFCTAVGDKTAKNIEETLWIAGTRPGKTTALYDFITVDDFVKTKKLSRVDFIKVDVDGWDYEVLLGAKKTIEAYRPPMIVEVNRGVHYRGHNEKQFMQYFYDLDYWIHGIDYPHPGNWLCLPGDRMKEYKCVY